MMSVSSLWRVPVICVCACCFLVSSCATTPEGQQQQMGAGIGALVGAAAGGLIGRDVKSAAIGGAAGALVGWSAVAISQYHDSQVRSAKDDQKVYGLTKVGDSPMVKIRRAATTPEQARPGQEVNFTTDYSVLLPKGMKGTSVEEMWVLKKDDKELQKFSPHVVSRNEGGYQTTGTIPLPEDTQPGAYILEHTVQSGTSYDTGQSVFYVGTKSQEPRGVGYRTPKGRRQSCDY